jgi:hypothetical protein
MALLIYGLDGQIGTAQRWRDCVTELLPGIELRSFAGRAFKDLTLEDIAAMTGACLADDTLTVTMAFTTPTRGPIALLYGVM